MDTILWSSARYGEYLGPANQNPKLLNGLAVTHKIDVSHGTLTENPEALPRVSVPPEVAFVPNADAAKSMLPTLDPALKAIVEGPAQALSPSGARAEIVNYEDDFYRIRFSAAADCLVRIAVPYYPGWSAAIDGHPADVLPVDYALMGVIVPAGKHELTVRFRSRWLALGATLSVVSLGVILGMLLLGSSVFARCSR